jgi:hypothetical protein
MAINLNALTTAIRRMGPAELFIGNPLVVSSMLSLGKLEGERRGEIEYSDNALTMPEHTAGVAHDVLTQVNKATVVGTIVLNAEGATIWPKINPLGSNAGGSSYFKRAQTTGVLLIPRSELGSSLRYDTLNARWERTEEDGSTIVTGAAAAPVHALWLWKARVKHGNVPYSFADGGRSLVDVTFEAMFDDTKPEGAKVFLIGDPRAFSTPIAAIL